jgi:hypothetical protein
MITSGTDDRARFEKAFPNPYGLARCGDPAYHDKYASPYTQGAWEGWQAALSHQAPAVAVSELEALDRWDVFAECGHNGSGYVERQVYDDGEFIRHDDLRTLINKAGSDE